ncbi:transcriptional regulator [Plantactinospora soyae]|uniref:DNA-binding transcriptional ArsR family regulator n=1 Tax=Plantactinospora soyae TaxID=1544732 RepID=A0A927MDY7_9ACTN|nr:transcriptional regulator [Plantactinospora soyae]MBE1491900.1 DNA-binding transcriptional ArsR family regulator [Plantactinospora soyae]
MIFLRLEPADLVRVRFADRLHPIGNTILACQALRDPALAAVMPEPASRGEAVAAATGPLRHLLPAQGFLPDFLTPYHGLESVAAGIEAIRATPRQRIRAELTEAYANLPATPWRRRFAAADRDVLELLTVSLARYYDAVLAPHWSDLTLTHRSWIARAAQTYALSGVDALLTDLHPAIRWRPPVLEIDSWWSGDVRGTGEGVLLIPTPFAGPRPRVLVEPGQPVLLVYPALALAPTGTARSGPDPLARLLGGTRAAVLRRLGEPGRHTTTTLGRHSGISSSSASEHATALRAAGLVSSDRAGGAIVHRLTPLGVHLLAQNASRPAGPGGSARVGRVGARASAGPSGPRSAAGEPWPEPGPP